MMVVACNTATAAALPALQAALPIPVIGVIEPGARAALAPAKKGPIGVIATTATTTAGAYPATIERLAPGTPAVSYTHLQLAMVHLMEVTEMATDETMFFDFDKLHEKNVKETLKTVYDALEEKGYNPINQIVGYLLSGDPAYIPRLNNARNLIRQHERDEIIEELVRSYLKNSGDVQ